MKKRYYSAFEPTYRNRKTLIKALKQPFLDLLPHFTLYSAAVSPTLYSAAVHRLSTPPLFHRLIMETSYPPLSVDLPTMESSSASEFTPTRLSFPNEFPYEFDATDFSPSSASFNDSTETEDEEDFLAGLTRRPASPTKRLPPPPSFFNTKPEDKRKIPATSPQSTLHGLRSSSNFGSRSSSFPPLQQPTTSFGRDNAWDVISAAAEEVAKLQHGSYLPHIALQNPKHSHLHPRQNTAFQIYHLLQQQRLLHQMWLCSQSRIGLTENLVPIRLKSQYSLSIPKHSVTYPKRPSSGTGVFLPRRYPTKPPSDSPKKPGTTSLYL